MKKLISFFIIISSLGLSCQAFGGRSVKDSPTACQRCEAFDKKEYKNLQAYSPAMKNALDELSKFEFSTDPKEKRKEIKAYILFAIKVISVDQLAMAKEHSLAAYESQPEDFELAMKELPTSTRQQFLKEIHQIKELHQKGDDSSPSN